MKKMLLVLCVLALMLIPMSSMAAMQSISDSEMAAVTGQAGVDIEVSAPQIDLGLQSITWGDPDGINGTSFDEAGYINLSIPTGLIAHIAISDLTISIDVGDGVTSGTASETAVQISLSTGVNITLDAFMVGIYVDAQNAVAQDYANALGLKTDSNIGQPGPYVLGETAYLIPEYAEWTDRPDTNLKDPPVKLNKRMLGVAGLSGLNVSLPQATVLTISTH